MSDVNTGPAGPGMNPQPFADGFSDEGSVRSIPWKGPLATFTGGVILALFAVIGGVATLVDAKNPPKASEYIVVYDAR